MSAAHTAPVATPRHPFIELLARYRQIGAAVWAHRLELDGPARLADEAAFLPAALSLQATPPHPAPRRAMYAIMALAGGALLWACVGSLDVVAVAQGRIVVSDGTKQVQPLETSVVRAIHVDDGTKVKAGQVLIELDPTMARADRSRVSEDRMAALSEAWRTAALIEAFNHGKSPALKADQHLDDAARQATVAQQLEAEWADLQAHDRKLLADIDAQQAELATVREQVAKLKATLPMVSQRAADFDTLAQQGFVSQHAGQDRNRARVEMEQDLATYRARREQIKVGIAQAEQARKAWRAEQLRTLNERFAKADTQQRQLAQDGAKADLREQLTLLKAPVSGTVQQLAVHTAGGVVTPAQVLLVVVPDQAQVTADVVIENKDIGFIEPGMPAEIKLETFPYTRYGTLSATVKSVSSDAVMQSVRDPRAQDVTAAQQPAAAGAAFPATLALEQRTLQVDGKQIALTPGMNLTAEIKTGRRKVIDYLLSPVQQHVQGSMKER